jgi:hypothetical protein
MVRVGNQDSREDGPASAPGSCDSLLNPIQSPGETGTVMNAATRSLLYIMPSFKKLMQLWYLQSSKSFRREGRACKFSIRQDQKMAELKSNMWYKNPKHVTCRFRGKAAPGLTFTIP